MLIINQLLNGFQQHIAEKELQALVLQAKTLWAELFPLERVGIYEGVHSFAKVKKLLPEAKEEKHAELAAKYNPYDLNEETHHLLGIILSSFNEILNNPKNVSAQLMHLNVKINSLLPIPNKGSNINYKDTLEFFAAELAILRSDMGVQAFDTSRLVNLFKDFMLAIHCVNEARKQRILLQQIWQETFPLKPFPELGNVIYPFSDIEASIEKKLSDPQVEDKEKLRSELEAKFNPYELNEDEHLRFFTALSVGYQIANNIQKTAPHSGHGHLESRNDVCAFRVIIRDNENNETFEDVAYHAEANRYVYANPNDEKAINVNNCGVMEKMLEVQSAALRSDAIIRSTLMPLTGSYFSIKEAVQKQGDRSIMQRFCGNFDGMCIDARIRYPVAFAGSTDFRLTFRELTQKAFNAYIEEFSELETNSYFIALAIFVRELWGKDFRKEFTSQKTLHPKEGWVGMSTLSIIQQRVAELVQEEPTFDFIAANKLLSPENRVYFLFFLRFHPELLQSLVVREASEEKDEDEIYIAQQDYDDFMLAPCVKSQVITNLIWIVIKTEISLSLISKLSVSALQKCELPSEFLKKEVARIISLQDPSEISVTTYHQLRKIISAIGVEDFSRQLDVEPKVLADFISLSFREMIEKFFKEVYLKEYPNAQKNSYFVALAVLIRELWGKPYNAEYIRNDQNLESKAGHFQEHILPALELFLGKLIQENPLKTEDFFRAFKLLPADKRWVLLKSRSLSEAFYNRLSVEADPRAEEKDSLQITQSVFDELMKLECVKPITGEPSCIAFFIADVVSLETSAKLFAQLSVQVLTTIKVPQGLISDLFNVQRIQDKNYQKNLMKIIAVLGITPAQTKDSFELINEMHQQGIFDPHLILVHLITKLQPQEHKAAPFWAPKNLGLWRQLLQDDAEEKHSEAGLTSLLSKFNRIQPQALQEDLTLQKLLCDFILYYPHLKSQLPTHAEIFAEWSIRWFDTIPDPNATFSKTHKKLVNFCSKALEQITTYTIDKLGLSPLKGTMALKFIEKELWARAIFLFASLPYDKQRKMLSYYGGFWANFRRAVQPSHFDFSSFLMMNYSSLGQDKSVQGNTNLIHEQGIQLLRDHRVQLLGRWRTVYKRFNDEAKEDIILFCKSYPIIDCFTYLTTDAKLNAEEAVRVIYELDDDELLLATLQARPLNTLDAANKSKMIQKLFNAFKDVILTLEETEKLFLMFKDKPQVLPKYILKALARDFPRIEEDYSNAAQLKLVECIKLTKDPFSLIRVAFDAVPQNYQYLTSEQQEEVFNLLCMTGFNGANTFEMRLQALTVLKILATVGVEPVLDASKRRELYYRCRVHPADEYVELVRVALISDARGLLDEPKIGRANVNMALAS